VCHSMKPSVDAIKGFGAAPESHAEG
jgi:hypothetical protein